VFWVVDNGSRHRGQAAARRLQGAWPTLRLVPLPIHASWLNQVEVYFSVIQRKILTPAEFTSATRRACRPCNLAKGDRDPARYILDRWARGLPVRQALDEPEAA
jgi:hypothetical protein